MDQHTAAGAAAASGVRAPVLRDTGDCTWTAGGLRTHGGWICLRAGARICTPPPPARAVPRPVPRPRFHRLPHSRHPSPVVALKRPGRHNDTMFRRPHKTTHCITLAGFVVVCVGTSSSGSQKRRRCWDRGTRWNARVTHVPTPQEARSVATTAPAQDVCSACRSTCARRCPTHLPRSAPVALSPRCDRNHRRVVPAMRVLAHRCT